MFLLVLVDLFYLLHVLVFEPGFEKTQCILVCLSAMNSQDSTGRREALKLAHVQEIVRRNEERSVMRKIRKLLKTDEILRTRDDNKFLQKYKHLVTEITKRKERRKTLVDRLKEVSNLPDFHM